MSQKTCQDSCQHLVNRAPDVPGIIPYSTIILLNRWLLLALLIMSGLYALPELFIRTTANFGGSEDICLLNAYGSEYGLYVAFREAIHF
jgi:hypothetical protein